MNCSMIANLLDRSHPHILKGCMLADELPTRRISSKKGIMYIVNTLTSKSPVRAMGHFILFFIRNNDFVYYDSFNLHPRMHGKHVGHFYEKQIKGRSLRTLNYRVQANYSHVCGAHVVYFAMAIIKYKSLNLVFKHLKTFYSRTNYNRNDRKVVEFIYSLKHDLPPCDLVFCSDTINYAACLKQICKSS